MKKVLSCICLVSLLFLLTACDPGIFQYDYDELKKDVVRVEYIYYNNPDAVKLDEFLVNKRDKLLPFDFDKMEIQATLSQDKVDEFLQDLCKYEIMMDWIHLDSPQGDSIRVVYEDGSFEALSICGDSDWNGYYSGSFYSNGDVKRFIGWGISRDFFSKWFDVQS